MSGDIFGCHNCGGGIGATGLLLTFTGYDADKHPILHSTKNIHSVKVKKNPDLEILMEPWLVWLSGLSAGL